MTRTAMTLSPNVHATPALLLDLIRVAGRTSRIELAAAARLTPATITNVIRDLMTQGLVREAGRAESRGGTPRRMLELDPTARYSVGIQLDRCTSSVVVVDFCGRPVAQATLAGSGRDAPLDTLRTLADHVEGLLASAAVPRDRVLGVGLVTHGPQDRARGVLLTPQPTPAWREYPLTERFAEILDLPVLLENDANAAGAGEQWVGGLPTNTFGVLYLASGLGGGVVVDGSLYRGRSSNAVEIGHVTLDAAGEPCTCGGRGCIANVCAPYAVVKRAMDDKALAARLGLQADRDATLADFERIARAAVRGDATARRLLESAAADLGVAAVTMVNLFDLDTVVLAGPALATAGPILRDGMAKVLEAAAFNRALQPVRVLLSRHGSIAAAVGGALLVLRAASVGHADGVVVSLTTAPAASRVAVPVH